MAPGPTARAAQVPSNGTVPEKPGQGIGKRVRLTASAQLPTAHGQFTVHTFHDRTTGAEHLVLESLVPGGLVRVHSECLTGDMLGSARCDCGPQLHASMELVAQLGGTVIYLRGHEGRGIGLRAKKDRMGHEYTP